MSPAEYMNEIVIPTLREFRDDPQSRRRAYLACVVVFHVKDHLRAAGERYVLRMMRVSCGSAFDAVHSVCNATKHQVTNMQRIYFKAGDDWYRPSESPDAGSSLSADRGTREIKHGDVTLDLYECAKVVAKAFQERYPAQLGGCDLTEF